MSRTLGASKRTLAFCLFLIALTICTTTSLAGTAGGKTPEDVVITAGGPINNGDTAWMLTSSALVLMMTGPGLALFYCGLVRKKNVLATMMQSFILMAVVTVVWAVIG